MNSRLKIVDLFSRIVDLLYLNLLFVISSIPVITLGASLTALYSVSLKMVRGEESYIGRSFFKAFRQNFVPATKGELILFIPSALMIANILITFRNPKATFLPILILSTFFLCILGCCILYFFPVLARFDFTVKQVFLHIIHMIATNPTKFIFLIVLIIPIIFLALYSTGTALTIVLIYAVIGSSLTAYVQSTIFRQIFEKYEQ